VVLVYYRRKKRDGRNDGRVREREGIRGEGVKEGIGRKWGGIKKGEGWGSVETAN